MIDKYKIYILQMYSNTIPSRIIKKLTKYNYTHIAISFDENCNIIYTFGRRKVNSFLHGGFVEETKDGEFYTKFNKTICRIYELQIDQKQYKQLKEIIIAMEKDYNKYKYDNIGILIRFFKIPIRFKNKYVCSYFIASLLERTGVYKFNKKVFFVRPQDFEKIDGIKEIYSGNYAMYNAKMSTEIY